MTQGLACGSWLATQAKNWCVKTTVTKAIAEVWPVFTDWTTAGQVEYRSLISTTRVQQPKKPSGSSGTRRAGSETRRSLSTQGYLCRENHHPSKHVCICVETLQRTSERSCTAWAGNKLTLAGEHLLMP